MRARAGTAPASLSGGLGGGEEVVSAHASGSGGRPGARLGRGGKEVVSAQAGVRHKAPSIEKMKRVCNDQITCHGLVANVITYPTPIMIDWYAMFA